MTRAELRDLVRLVWHDAERSWVTAGLAFARLAPHIIDELNKAEEREQLATGPVIDAGADTLEEGVRRVVSDGLG